MDYDPDLFRGAAGYYDRFRAPYATTAVEFLIRRLRLTSGSRIIDLGCGPGTLARRLAGCVAEVLAMDPDAGMLAEGRRLAASEGVSNIHWMQAGSAELCQLTGQFRAAVLGQSFHWMDRDKALGDLHRLIEEGGAIGFINPGRRRPQESWEPAAMEIIERYLGPAQAHPQRNREARHEPAIERSAFEVTDDIEFSAEIVRDLPSVLGVIYSKSGSTPWRFGERLKTFESDLAAQLLRLNPSGEFHETIETGVLIAQKR